VPGYSGYRRAAPPLPDPDTLPFPGNMVRRCEDCNLHNTCKSPVPGENISPREIMLIGQNPGFFEGEFGRPFCGQSGQYLESLLFRCSIPRESVAISNMVHCLTPNNRELRSDEIKACAHWLDMELGIVNPRIIVAMGKPAIDRFLGKETDTVEKVHGKPVIIDGRIILPAYHPAAALHNTTLLRQVGDDFNVLRGLAKGIPPENFVVVDEYPNPEYIVADTPHKLKQMMDEIRDSGECAIDVENVNHNQDFWSYQVSAVLGRAWFVPMPKGYRGMVDTTGWGAHIIVHYYLNDSKWLKIRDDDFTDSMTLAYLTGNPQGLKDLSYRLCGVKMQSYREVVRSGQRKLSVEYLNRVAKGKWKDPPPIEETKWNNKKGEITTRIKKPWHISRKISSILSKIEEDAEYDPYDAWRDIDPLERAEVESLLGLMPESSLADINFSDAVSYACRDSLMTLRVTHKMRAVMQDLDLELISSIDHGILPMVQDMMKNGMAIDLEHYKRLSEDYDVRLRVKAAELSGMVGHSFNPCSSPQVATVIYRELGFKPTKYTATKEISTDDRELKKTKHQWPKELSSTGD
jgi:uracil-DNA glycosylase family 4